MPLPTIYYYYYYLNETIYAYAVHNMMCVRYVHINTRRVTILSPSILLCTKIVKETRARDVAAPTYFQRVLTEDSSEETMKQQPAATKQSSKKKNAHDVLFFVVKDLFK